MSLRTEQFEELLKRELGQYFLKEVEFPSNSLVTITRTKVSPDLKVREVWLSILPEKFIPGTLKIISKKIKNFEKNFFRKMSSKFTPKITFKIDAGENEAAEVEKLLKEIKNESSIT